MRARRARPCESVDGEWGKPCPACGQVLPKPPGPLRSWKAQRAPRDYRDPAIRDTRPPPLRTRPGPPERLTLDEVAAAIREHVGNVARAARDLLVQPPTVAAYVQRHRHELPGDVLDMIEARRRRSRRWSR